MNIEKLIAVEELGRGRPLSTATEHAFSVLCNDDCYRASLAMHSDAASLRDFVTLVQIMRLCTQAELRMDRVHGSSKKIIAVR